MLLKTYCFSLFISFSVFVVGSCSSDSKNRQNDLDFNVNKSLLGDIFIDSVSGLVVRVPVGWRNSDLFTNDTLKAKLSQLHLDSLGKTMYLDSSQRASLLITRLIENENLALIYQSPDSAYNTSKKWTSITKSEFLLNGMRTYQFLLQSEALVNFRLLVTSRSKKSVQIDYLIDRSVYLHNVKKIESSIGTIESFN
jgi:hypothetical protein